MFRRKCSLGCNDVKQSSNAVSTGSDHKKNVYVFFSYIENIYTLHTAHCDVAIYEITMYYDKHFSKMGNKTINRYYII